MTKEIIHKHLIKTEIKNEELILNDGEPINFDYLKHLIAAKCAGQKCKFVGLIVEGKQLYLQYYFQ